MRAVNLIPSEHGPGSANVAARSQGAAYIVLALIAALALMAYLYGIARHQVSSRQAQVASLNARTQQAQATAARLAPYTSFATLREQRTQAVAQLVDTRFDWAYTLHELGRVLPAGASISSLNGTVGSATGSSAAPASSAATPTTSPGASSVSSATPPGSVPSFTLSGCATSQQEVALTLNRLRLMDGVGDVSLQSSTAAGGSGAGGSECSGGEPAFTVQLTFAPLPAPAAKSAAPTALTSATSGAGR